MPIKHAETLPASFYSNPVFWEKTLEHGFFNNWQFIGRARDLLQENNLYPFYIVQEPILLTRTDDGAIHCVSNVCTHRGFVMINEPVSLPKITCAYHGRRFGLDGQFEYMPEFEQAADFPRQCDNLTQLPLKEWHGFLFTSVLNQPDLDRALAFMDERIGFLPVSDYKFSKKYSKTHTVNAHWALYCDNYLEGFHIPFVHEDLNAVLDYGNYETLCDGNVVLQTGYGKEGEPCFDLPDGHIDFGKTVSAYYFWLYPNMMFNFYPWGVSVNVVRPVTKDLTKVDFITYIGDMESYITNNAFEATDKVEDEDEIVVEQVNIGVKSKLYKTGRFSPRREKGVYHFHSILKNIITG